jgi:hypothetical protein
MIYIGSPFSHSSAEVMKERHDRVFAYSANLMLQGVVCFSPIVYGWPFFSRGHAPANFEWWIDFNDHMLLSSFEVQVLQLPGWQDSRGLAHEIDLASRHGIPVRYIQP